MFFIFFAGYIDASLLSFCDRTDRLTDVTAVPIHAVITAIEVKAVREIAIALVRRRTPIVSEASGEVER